MHVLYFCTISLCACMLMALLVAYTCRLLDNKRQHFRPPVCHRGNVATPRDSTGTQRLVHDRSLPACMHVRVWHACVVSLKTHVWQQVYVPLCYKRGNAGLLTLTQ